MIWQIWQGCNRKFVQPLRVQNYPSLSDCGRLGGVLEGVPTSNPGQQGEESDDISRLTWEDRKGAILVFLSSGTPVWLRRIKLGCKSWGMHCLIYFTFSHTSWIKTGKTQLLYVLKNLSWACSSVQITIHTCCRYLSRVSFSHFQESHIFQQNLETRNCATCLSHCGYGSQASQAYLVSGVRLWSTLPPLISDTLVTGLSSATLPPSTPSSRVWVQGVRCYRGLSEP